MLQAVIEVFERDKKRQRARLKSCKTDLRFEDWTYFHRARLDILPLRGYFWSEGLDKSCRKCGKLVEDGFHVLNSCKSQMVLYTKRHDAILQQLHQVIARKGYAAKVNRAIAGQRLRPDLEMIVNGTRVMVYVVVAFDIPENLAAAFNRKIEKYQSFGKILPLVVGSLGSWPSSNNDIMSFLKLDSRIWKTFTRKAKLTAIQHTMCVIRCHIGCRATSTQGDLNQQTDKEDDRSSLS